MTSTKGITHWIVLFSLVIMGVACNESRYLGERETLWVANKVKIHSSEKITKKKEKRIASELGSLTRPRLNGKILGIRVKLWIYNIAGKTNKTKGFKHWLKYKVGEPPVLATPTLIEKNREIMQNHLENKGWFHDSVTSATEVKNKKLTAIYTAQIGPRYTINNVRFPYDDDTLGKVVDTLRRRSLLKKGDAYDLDNIKEERTRIDTRLKNRGFYYFSPDYLQVDVDSTVGNHQVNMQLNIKDETPSMARNIYKINEVNVYAHYDIRSDTSMSKAYTTPEGYHILDTMHYLRPIVFRKTLVFKPGDTYKTNDHNTSLSRLVSLGVFKFVKVRFEPVDTTSETRGQLNAYYYLTPTQKKSIRFEVSGLTRSDNTTGSEISVSWRNRNFFKGAELFTATAYAGLEEQFIGNGQKIGTRRGGVNFDLYIPRIISPFDLNTSAAFVPKTKINAAYDLFARTRQYTLTSARTSYGYIFKNRLNSENQLTVLGINYVRPTNIDPVYQRGLDTNITLRRAIERQFIIGPIYNFNYNSQTRPNRHMNNYYFNGNVDLSGNMLGIFTGANINKGKQVNIFNVPFAQYIRLEADFRHYLNFNKYSMFASRITGGIGYSWGNSTTMPFIKEFFAGGTNDIRAFRSRALGPGKFFAGNPNTQPILPDQPGDIKLEMNLEYRMKLFALVRGALFMDAGNIWTLRTDSSRIGSKFTGSFLKDIAVGVGAGLRFDLTILVLRVDVAAPVRFPWRPEGSKWSWRSATDISNMVLNLAIGYPF